MGSNRNNPAGEHSKTAANRGGRASRSNPNRNHVKTDRR